MDHCTVTVPPPTPQVNRVGFVAGNYGSPATNLPTACCYLNRLNGAILDPLDVIEPPTWQTARKPVGFASEVYAAPFGARLRDTAAGRNGTFFSVP